MTKREAYKNFTVVCIDDFYDTLTLGKLYQVGIYDIIEKGSPEESYIIENDEGYTECFYSDSFKIVNKARNYWYTKECFEPLEERRDKLINELLNDI